MKLPGLFVVGAVVAAATGCGDTGTGNAKALQSRYGIQLADGKPLPFTTYSSGLTQARLEVISGEIVPLSRSMLLDIVEYQATSVTGVKLEPYKDTVAVAYVFGASELTLTRQRSNGATREETWTVAEGVLVAPRMFKNSLEIEIGPITTNYVVRP